MQHVTISVFCNFEIEDKDKNCDHFAPALKGSRLQCQVLIRRLMQLICLWKVLNTLFFIFFDFSFGFCSWYPEVAIDWRMQWRAHCKYWIVFHNIRCHILKPKQLVVDWYFYELDITHKCKYTQKLNRTVARYQM